MKLETCISDLVKADRTIENSIQTEGEAKGYLWQRRNEKLDLLVTELLNAGVSLDKSEIEKQIERK